MVSLLGLHGRNIQLVADDQLIARATLLAQQAMTEALVAEVFPDPTRSRGDFPGDPGYHWEAEILRGPTRELEEVTREVRVRVFWDGDEDGGVRLVTLLRKPE